MDDIWKEFTFINHMYPFSIMKCTSIQIPTCEICSKNVGPVREYLSASLTFDNSKFEQIMIEFKGRGQSSQNIIPDFENSLLYRMPATSQDFYDFKVQSKKQLTECDPYNNQKTFECIEKFLASKADCRFSWLDKRYVSQTNSKICNKTEELKLHLETSFKVYQRKLDDELRKFGCLQRNCLEKIWQPQKMFSTENLTIGRMKNNYPECIAMQYTWTTESNLNNKYWF